MQQSYGSYGKSSTLSASLTSPVKMQVSAVGHEQIASQKQGQYIQSQAAKELLRVQSAQAAQQQAQLSTQAIQNQVMAQKAGIQALSAGAAPGRFAAKLPPRVEPVSVLAPSPYKAPLRQAAAMTPVPTASFKNRPMAPVMPTVQIHGGVPNTAPWSSLPAPTASTPTTPGTPLHQPTRPEGTAVQTPGSVPVPGYVPVPVAMPAAPAPPAIVHHDGGGGGGATLMPGSVLAPVASAPAAAAPAGGGSNYLLYAAGAAFILFALSR